MKDVVEDPRSGDDCRALPVEAVDHPPHYGGGDNPHETIKCLRAWGCFDNALRFNSIKYLSRAGKKGDVLEDLRKARWYLDAEIRDIDEHRANKVKASLPSGGEKTGADLGPFEHVCFHCGGPTSASPGTHVAPGGKETFWPSCCIECILAGRAKGFLSAKEAFASRSKGEPDPRAGLPSLVEMSVQGTHFLNHLNGNHATPHPECLHRDCMVVPQRVADALRKAVDVDHHGVQLRKMGADHE